MQPEHTAPENSAFFPAQQPRTRPSVAFSKRQAQPETKAGLPESPSHNFRTEAEASLGSTLWSPGVSEGPPGHRRGPLEVGRPLLGVRVVDLRDVERPWPATGPGSSSGSAATARSLAGGCDGEGRVGVRGQRSGGRAVLLDCGWGRSLGKGTWAPRRLLGDVKGSGTGGRQWECGVWKVTVAVPKNKEDEELPQVPPEPGRLSPAKLLCSLGKLEGTDPGHVLESLVESGNWSGRGSACR